jgi:hypothetical protein
MRTLILMLLMVSSAIAGTKHIFDRPVFEYAHHPDLPISAYAGGRLGIPLPGHARIYLYAAYRYLDDKPFTAEEQDAFLRVWKARIPQRDPSGTNESHETWTRLRATVPSSSDGSASTPFASPKETRQWTWMEVCSDDAFDEASKTLREHIRRYGARSAEVEFWVKGQDRVWTACRAPGTALPEAAPATMPAVIRADRDYQIAAALLYSQRLDEALERFRSIAADNGSRWQVWAPYLIGRTLLWKARLTQEQQAYQTNLRLAEAQFVAVLRNPKLKQTHAAAERLLDRCLLITQPKAGLERISARLLKPESAGSRVSDLLMYLNSLDSMLGSGGENSIDPSPLPADEFSKWWSIFQSASPNSYTQALDQWRRTGRMAWLYCALSKAQSDSGLTDALLKEALKVDIGHPAGAALHFQAARLLAAKGRVEEARPVLDAVLPLLQALPSARNHALVLKFQLARDVDELFRLAPRAVIMASDELDVSEFENRRDRNQALAKLDRLDLAGARVLSEKLPLEVLRTAALKQGSLPPHLMIELRLIVWTRAVLLGRFDIAREFAPLISRDHPASSHELEDFLATPPGRPAEIAAAYVLLKLPGARPYFSQGYGRLNYSDKFDLWDRNWWYRFTPPEMYEVDFGYWRVEETSARSLLSIALPCLTSAQRQQSDEEWKQLRRGAERGLEWLTTRIVEDIQAHPRRPGAAETLFDMVSMTGFNLWSSPPDSELPHPGYSAAYRLLSTRYSNSTWHQKAMQLPGRYRFADKP